VSDDDESYFLLHKQAFLCKRVCVSAGAGVALLLMGVGASMLGACEYFLVATQLWLRQLVNTLCSPVVMGLAVAPVM
jgi:hypothetical protein